MGYFKRRLDRGRSREQMQRLHDSALEEGAWEPCGYDAPRRAGAQRFLRFSIGEEHPWSGRRMGVFTAAYRLRREGELDAATRDGLDAVLRWFEENLPAPDFDVDAAIFLFRPDAGECTSRIWHLVHLLREGGLPAEMQTIGNPGKLVYEDEFQVAVVPWSSSRTL